MHRMMLWHYLQTSQSWKQLHISNRAFHYNRLSNTYNLEPSKEQVRMLIQLATEDQLFIFEGAARASGQGGNGFASWAING